MADAAYHRAWREDRRSWMREQKESRPCDGCGVKYPYYIMDWHHRDESEKSFPIGPGSGSRSREKLAAEIAKCDLLCANCHRTVHHERRLREDT